MKESQFSRRTFIRNTSLTAAGTIVGSLAGKGYASDQNTPPIAAAACIEQVIKNGNINQSVSRWCYKDISLDELCAAAAKMGLKGIDLLGPKDFATVKKYGLTCSMVHGPGISIDGEEKKQEFAEKMRNRIDEVAEAGFPNVITFSPWKQADKAEALRNSVETIKKIIGHAEKKKVTICIEYLNTKVDHPDYTFNNMNWGVELCKRVGSENMKILYDIYHAQIMEGDVIHTIRDYHQYIGHYHTGGVPGRNEIDETQELYYPAIMRAIVKTGFVGYVSHEFVPTRDPLTSLAQAARICDV